MLKWHINSLPEGKEVHYIGLITYGCTKDRLTRGSLTTLELAKKLAIQFPEAVILWGKFAKNSASEHDVEKKLREDALSGFNHVYVGEVSSTTDECEAMLFRITSPTNKNVVVIAEGAHSRRARLVWEHFIPRGMNVFFESVAPWEADDQENPMVLQKKWWVWLAVNALLLPFYKWFPGVGWFAKRNFSQPT